MNFTSDFQEKDIVFGGDKKLAKLIAEIEMLFPLQQGHFRAVRVPDRPDRRRHRGGAKKGAKEINKPIVPVRCEGFRGVSQSLGHHIANDAIRDWVLDKRDGQAFEATPYDVSIIGDYNIGGDAWASRILLEEMGLRVVSQWSGDGTLAEMEKTPKVKLNLLHCYRSMNYISRHMEEKYGIPWLEYNFFGPTKIAESLRKIAAQFDDHIKEGAERVIAKYQPMMEAVIAKYKPRLQGKTVMLYVGGLRPRHVIGAYEDLGMEVIGTGYEFATTTTTTARSRKWATPRCSTTTPPASSWRSSSSAMKPDLVGSGIKEKYVFQKMGIPLRQMHSWDYSGPYHGYDGFAIFARDMDMAISNPCWSKQTPPWKKLPEALEPTEEGDLKKVA
jgi:nitrogenase molybdenum-iron protein alpha chain